MARNVLNVSYSNPLSISTTGPPTGPREAPTEEWRQSGSEGRHLGVMESLDALQQILWWGRYHTEQGMCQEVRRRYLRVSQEVCDVYYWIENGWEIVYMGEWDNIDRKSTYFS